MPKKSDKKQKLDVAALVDELGALRAQESALGDRDKEISAALVGALGVGGEAEGTLFRVVIVQQDRTTLDQAAVRAALSEQFIADHSKTNQVVFAKVGAKKKPT